MNKKIARIALVALSLLGATSFYAWNRMHSGVEAGHGHEHGGDGLQFTHFSDQTELFLELPRLVVGREAASAAHLTRLADFKAVPQGQVLVSLLEQGSQTVVASARVDQPSVPGIFRPVLKPPRAGDFRLLLQLEGGGLKASHDLGKVRVHADEAGAHAEASPEHQGAISFTKERQWKMDFATALAEQQDLRAAVSGTGVLRAHPDQEAGVVAPMAGTLNAAGSFPRVGQTVAKGQVLAYLVPRLGADTDLATLEAALRKARLSFEQATRERERMDALLAQEAVAQKRLQAAVTDEKLAKADLDAAERRFGQYQGQGGGVALRAPVAGTLSDVPVTPGSFVAEGQRLFHVVNRQRLWLEVRVAENDIARIGQPVGAWFALEGSESGVSIEEGKSGKLIAVGAMMDPTTRTVPVIYELHQPDARLRIGMNVKAFLYTGSARAAITVPASALVDDNGQAVVYVQKGGESYERRVVETGIRDAHRLEVRHGLALGERVVSRGAYQLRLAALSPAAVGHGHAH